VVVDDECAGRPALEPRRLGQRGVGDLVQADDRRVALERAGRGRHRADPAVGPLEALQPRAEVERHAPLLERLVNGLGHVGVEQLVQHPRALVDQVDVEPAVPHVARHLHGDRPGADDHHALHRVQPRVELHRLADVLHVVQPLEVPARDVGLLPVEPGAHDELVEALGLVARRDGAAVEVDVGDDGLHAHVQAVGLVALDGGQEEVLELRDLAPVDERDPAR
jgi:hypothetical protein